MGPKDTSQASCSSVTATRAVLMKMNWRRHLISPLDSPAAKEQPQSSAGPQASWDKGAAMGCKEKLGAPAPKPHEGEGCCIPPGRRQSGSAVPSG